MINFAEWEKQLQQLYKVYVKYDDFDKFDPKCQWTDKSKLKRKATYAKSNETSSEQELCDIEATIGNSIPSSLRETLLKFSKRIELNAILPYDLKLPDELRQLGLIYFLISSEEIARVEEYRKEWITNCFTDQDDPYSKVWHNKLGFMKVGNGDVIAFDLSDPKDDKRVVYLSHDDGEGHGYILGENFADYFSKLLLIGGCGNEDWNMMPFMENKFSGINPNCENAKKYRKIIGLHWDNRVYFHEDDYCMIEIMPSVNQNFCQERATKAKDFSEKHRAENGFGFTDVFLLEEVPNPLKGSKITVIAFENALSSIMKKSDIIYTDALLISDSEDGDGTVKCKNTAAFIKGDLQVFYEYENGFIEKIWLQLDIRKAEEKAFAESLLQVLGKISDLILVDNYKNKVVPLSNQQAIQDYLQYIYIHNTILFSNGASQWGKENKDNDGYTVIAFSNSDLIEITKAGIKYRSFLSSYEIYIDFNECAKNYFAEIKKGTGKCVGERSITAEQPFIEFSTLPVKTRMIFGNTKKGLLKNFRDDSKKQFHNVCQKIINAGFSTFDLS